LFGPQLRHEMVILRIVRDIAGLVLLLESAQPVLEAGRARLRPGARERLLVADIRQEDILSIHLSVRLRREARSKLRQIRHIGDEPRHSTGPVSTIRPQSYLRPY